MAMRFIFSILLFAVLLSFGTEVLTAELTLCREAKEVVEEEERELQEYNNWQSHCSQQIAAGDGPDAELLFQLSNWLGDWQLQDTPKVLALGQILQPLIAHPILPEISYWPGSLYKVYHSYIFYG